MTNAPYLLPKAREGYRLGHAQVIDSMINDGLWDAYKNVSTWATAPSCARRRRASRAPTRTRSPPSRTAARCAPQAEGKFKREIVPVEIAQRKGPPTVVADDEEPGRGDVAKLGALRPAFQKDGTVTAGNASSINDGAAALVLTGADAASRARLEAARAHRRGRRPRAGARVVHDRAGGRDRDARSSARAGRRTTSISGRSTKRSRWCRSRTTSCSDSIRRA